MDLACGLARLPSETLWPKRYSLPVPAVKATFFGCRANTHGRDGFVKLINAFGCGKVGGLRGHRGGEAAMDQGRGGIVPSCLVGSSAEEKAGLEGAFFSDKFSLPSSFWLELTASPDFDISRWTALQRELRDGCWRSKV